jgi:cytidyltransferase-like protein
MTVKVATWGTFDGELHIGHIKMLEFCSNIGDLTVFIVSDVVAPTRKRIPLFPQGIRASNVSRTGLAKNVIIGSHNAGIDMENTISSKPDVFVFSSDHTDEWCKELRRRLEEIGTRIIVKERYPGVSTTSLYFSGEVDEP